MAHAQVDAWKGWMRQHPEAARRLERLDDDIARLDRGHAPHEDLDLAVGWDLREIDLDLGRPPPRESPGHGLGLGL